MKTFYILWHPEGQRPPTVRFDTLGEATKCAESMMERIGHGTMFVMKAMGGLEVTTKVEQFKRWEATGNDNNEIPKKTNRRRSRRV